MLAKIELDYDAKRIVWGFAKLENRYAEIKEIFGGDFPDFDKLQNEEHGWYSIPETSVINLETEGQRLSDLGVPFTIKKLRGTMLSPFVPENSSQAWQKIYVQVPNIGLMMIDEVKVEEDYCTEALQRDLNYGWRMIAVCPPNGVRRPSYILGRTKEDR